MVRQAILFFVINFEYKRSNGIKKCNIARVTTRAPKYYNFVLIPCVCNNLWRNQLRAVFKAATCDIGKIRVYDKIVIVNPEK